MLLLHGRLSKRESREGNEIKIINGERGEIFLNVREKAIKMLTVNNHDAYSYSSIGFTVYALHHYDSSLLFAFCYSLTKTRWKKCFRASRMIHHY